MMRIYADRELLAPDAPTVLMLQPFWGESPEDPTLPTAGRFSQYMREGSSLFEPTDPASADVHVYPNPFDRVAQRPGGEHERLEAFVRRAALVKKPAVVFIGGDSEAPLPFDDAWVFLFRFSLSRATRSARQFAMPAWSEDFVTRYLGGRLPLRKKGSTPIVGFCGLGAPDLRAHALRVLSRSSRIEARFIIHHEFWGGAFNGGDRGGRMRAARQRFVANVVDSDYTLCVRGAGNFSYRLYEALCCGRIPVFVDTDCVLPYEDAIDWKRLCVWVDRSELDRIDRIVAEHHAALSDRAFEARQRECRTVWEEWLSPVGFHRHFARHFA